MNVLSLFSNVGFGEVLLKHFGINVVCANEMLSDRCELYKDLHPDTEVICGDISDSNIQNSIFDYIEDMKIDLILATPPCQGMSVANATKNPNDPRNKLIVHAMDFFAKLTPDYMLIENVPGFAKTFININGSTINTIDYIKSRLPSGHSLTFDILNAKDYNTPQSRKRFIGLISKGGSWKLPKKNSKIKTVRDAISHLPSMESGESSNLPWHYAKSHNSNHVMWMKNTPTGQTAFNNKIPYPQKDGRNIKGFQTTYKRIDWAKPSPTVTMYNGAIPSQNNVHPGNLLTDGTYSDARVMSIRELLVLCGLPEDLLDKFAGKYSDNFIRKVLGECFPPTMCAAILNSIPNG